MENQSGLVEFFEIFGLVGLGEGLDAIVRGHQRRQHALGEKRIAQTLRDFAVRTIGAVERGAEILEKLGTVGLNGGTELVENRDREAERIIGSL